MNNEFHRMKLDKFGEGEIGKEFRVSEDSGNQMHGENWHGCVFNLDIEK